MKTVYGIEVSNKMFYNRVGGLVNQFFKILPIKENGEATLQKYMLSLQKEMLGLHSLIVALHDDQQYLSLLSILQYLIEHECDIATVRSEVFKAINILKRLQKKLEDISEVE